jgi:hypothetical protein
VRSVVSKPKLHQRIKMTVTLPNYQILVFLPRDWPCVPPAIDDGDVTARMPGLYMLLLALEYRGVEQVLHEKKVRQKDLGLTPLNPRTRNPTVGRREHG